MTQATEMNTAQLELFNTTEAGSFFWLQEARNRKVGFRFEQFAHMDYSRLLMQEPMPASSFVRIGKVQASDGDEVGFYVEVPNLMCDVGRNYVVVKRSRDLKRTAIKPRLIYKISHFMVMEVPNEMVAIIRDNTGDFQL